MIDSKTIFVECVCHFPKLRALKILNNRKNKRLQQGTGDIFDSHSKSILLFNFSQKSGTCTPVTAAKTIGVVRSAGEELEDRFSSQAEVRNPMTFCIVVPVRY